MEDNMEILEETGLEEGEQAPVADDAAPESNPNAKTVSINELLAAKPAEGSTGKTEKTEKPAPDARGAAQKPSKGEKTFTQADLDRILNERLTEERRKPAYQYGQAAISARAKKDGVTEAEAFNRIRSEDNARKAKEYAENPEKAYADMLDGTFNPYNQQTQQQQQPNPQQQFRFSPDQVAESLETMQKSGLLPEGFSPESVTDDFARDAMQNGVKSALYNWMISNGGKAPTRSSTIQELERRRQMPKPMQSGGGNIAPRPTNVKGMSKEEFDKLDAEIEKGNRAGYSVRLQE